MFVEFQLSCLIIPPFDVTAPVVKVDGAVLSKIILLRSVVDFTIFPWLPEESEKLISNSTVPLLSVLLKK